MKKIKSLDKKFEKFRWFFTSSGTLVVGGKSDEQNEEALENFLKPNYIVMHTTKPGSAFMIIQKDNPLKKDLEETAIFCASFSQAWKKGLGLIEIDIFKGNQIFKEKSMKTGTFGVKGIKKTIKVKPELYLVIQNSKLRAVPIGTEDEILAKISQGKMSKLEAADKLSKIIKSKYAAAYTRDEIMAAIPADKLDVSDNISK